VADIVINFVLSSFIDSFIFLTAFFNLTKVSLISCIERQLRLFHPHILKSDLFNIVFLTDMPAFLIAFSSAKLYNIQDKAFKVLQTIISASSMRMRQSMRQIKNMF